MIKQLVDVVFVFDYIHDQHKTQEMCDRVVSEDPFFIVYCILNKELMQIVWHPKRWWNLCMSEDENKEIEPIFS